MPPARLCSEERDWNVGRCHRLLRPVTSRLAILRSRGLVTAQNIPEKQKKDPVTTSANVNGDDPDWTDQTQKRGCKKRRQYGRRREGSPKPSRQVRTTTNLRPGEIPIATPLLSRTSHFTVEGSPNTPMSFFQLSKLAESRSRSLEHQSIMAGLRQALRTVFEQTHPEPSKPPDASGTLSAHEVSKKGPRSLFETCLRKIPAYIATEEQFHKEDNPDHRDDISSGIYDELEGLPAIWGRRSYCLRTVLRSQALFLFHQAVCEGLMDGKDIMALSSMVVRRGKMSHQIITFEEVNYLHQAWLTRQSRIPYPKAASDHIADVGNHQSHLISTAYSMARGERTFEAGCNVFQQLIASHKLPAQWLVTRRMGGVLAHAMKAVVSPIEDSFHASRLLSTAILHCCGLQLPPDLAVEDISPQLPGSIDIPNHQIDDGMSKVFEVALDLTMQSLAVPLFAIAYTSDQNVNPENPAYRLLWDVITDIILAIRSGASETGRSISNNRRIFGFLFVGLMLGPVHSTNGKSSSHDLGKPTNHVLAFTEDIIDAMSNLISQIEGVPGILRAMAHYCSRATRRSQKSHFQELHQHLLPLLSNADVPQRISKRFSNAYHAISKELDTADDLDALQVKPAIATNSSGPIDLAPAQKGYHWEEGIEEWVIDSMNSIVLGATSGLRKPGAFSTAVQSEEAERLESSSSRDCSGDDGSRPLGPPETSYQLCGSPSQMSHSGLDLADESSASEAEPSHLSQTFRKDSSRFHCDSRAQKRKRSRHTFPLLVKDPATHLQPNVPTSYALQYATSDSNGTRSGEGRQRSSEAIRSRIAHVRRPLANRSVNGVGKRRRSQEFDSGFASMDEGSTIDGVFGATGGKRRRTRVGKTRSLRVSDLAMARADEGESDDELSFL